MFALTGIHGVLLQYKTFFDSCRLCLHSLYFTVNVFYTILFFSFYTLSGFRSFYDCKYREMYLILLQYRRKYSKLKIKIALILK